MIVTKVLPENLKGRNLLGHLGLDGRLIILKWFVKNRVYSL
jgi:hypothetical protein